MYKLVTKNGSIVFMEIEDLMLFVVSRIDRFVNDDDFIKIIKVEDIEK